MVEVWLPYGRTEICVRLPANNLLQVIEPRKREAAGNPQAEIKEALLNPYGTKRLAEIVKPEDNVCVVLRDSGASTNNMMVSAILGELNSAGVEDKDVTVISAYDPLRAPLTQREPVGLGSDLSNRISVVWHDCEASEHLHVGRTPRGIDVYLNRMFVQADVKVLAGLVEPHLFAGYSGGPEAVLPGVASIESVQNSFLLGVNGKAERGALEGNPVHEEMVDAAQLAGVDFALNVVRNSELDVVKAFAGNVNAAFNEAARLADEIFKVPIESRADVVFASPGGSSFDSNLFEACICLDSALEAAKRRKAIVLVAECVEGCGKKEFLEAMSKTEDPKDLRKSLKRHFSVAGFMAYRLMTALQSTRIVLVSAMPDYYVSETFRMKSARTANEAFRLVSDVLGKNGKVSFIPYGNLTIPFVKTAE